MSKASEFVQSDFAMRHPRRGHKALRFEFPDSSHDAQVGWVQDDLRRPRTPILTFVTHKRVELLPEEAIAFARWILDTFGDSGSPRSEG